MIRCKDELVRATIVVWCCLHFGGGCGLVNGLDGPWPLIAPETSDAGEITGPKDPVPCIAGEHNGGDGFCAADGECSSGFAMEETGYCSRWLSTESLSPLRTKHSVTSLPSGYVLSAGGKNGDSALDGVSLYDPNQDAWIQVSALSEKRHSHEAVLLSSNRTLIAGGYGESEELIASSYIFRGSIGDWTGSGSLQIPRVGHRIVDVEENGVLVLGGKNSDDEVLTSIEVYIGGEWTAAANGLSRKRSGMTATRLLSGKVLIAGGEDQDGATLDGAEIFDPETQTSAFSSSMADDRTGHQAMLLETGKVLVVGGYAKLGESIDALRTAELFDPEDQTWSDTGFMRTPRFGHHMLSLPDGRVLISGGFSSAGNAIRSVEIYDSAQGAFLEASSLIDARGYHGAGLLGDGRVLVVQGQTEADEDSLVSTVEVYQYAQ